ncbi:tyrosine-type recombinase/integrase [Shimia aestuarii]|uniref:Site-specific recombinase XerD n=1 Tax=Shimia aestuarii TaxID=254406 RepID=A0A1I4N7F9_9RHOB|nr:tyrosine-type recombinase/integrase [Shimia aestuarii]SFM11335.1 Site-specific recombinase XerD [Shimia aestuarii]
MASIYRSRDKWTAQVNLDGKRRSRTFSHKRDAERWARQEEAHQDTTGTVTAAIADLRLNDVIEAYLDEFGDQASRSKLGTIRHISELIGRTPLPDLTSARIREFAKMRRAEGAGPATIGQDLTYIHTILKMGGAVLDVDTDTALGAYTKARAILNASGAVGRPKERDRRPSDGELVALRNHWAQRRRVVPMWDLTRFAIATAMRLSEITRIKWDDLDVEGRMIWIRDRKHPRAKIGNDQNVPLLLGPVVIDGETVDPLELVLAQRREAPEIFPHDPRTVSTTFTRGVASCGIDDLRFHDLRHDGVSRLFEAGYQIEQVSLVSGHQDWAQLRRYTQIKPESLHR